MTSNAQNLHTRDRGPAQTTGPPTARPAAPGSALGLAWWLSPWRS
jgi:hypothetical protein